MPSPIGHALAGMAAGWLVQPAPVPAGRSAVVGRLCLFGAVGSAPDLDLLVGAHSGPSHGLGAAIVVGVVAWGVMRAAGWRKSGLLAVAMASAYATHILLDWLGTDTSAPIGIMVLWPFSHAYYESGAHVFMAISRRYWLPEFWTHNFIAMGRELLILLPVAAACLILRRPR